MAIRVRCVILYRLVALAHLQIMLTLCAVTPPLAVANTEQVSAAAQNRHDVHSIDGPHNLLQKPILLVGQLINVVIEYFAYLPEV